MLFESLIVTVPIFLITLLLVRRVLYSIFDPFMLTLFALSASLGVMFYVSYANHLMGLGTALVFVLSHLAFILGLLVGRRSGFRIKHSFPHRRLYLKLPFMDMLLLVVMGVLLLCFLFMLRTVGLIIFQPDVLAARTTLLTGGYGILKRVLEAGVTFAFALILVRNHYRRLHPLLFWPYVGVLVLMSAAMGNKGFLFTFYALFVYYLAFLNKNLRFRIPRKLWLAAGAAILLVLVGATANLVLTASGGEGEGSSLLDALVKLGNRIAGFGDIGYFFFENNAYKVLQKTVVDYAGYISNDILGFFRLREYGVSPGAEIYAIVVGHDNPEGFGPNAQVYFVGYMFFQSLGIIYSFLIGWLFAVTRRLALLNLRVSNLDMLLFILINFLITPLGMDLQLVLVQTFNMVLVITPLIVFSFVIYSVVNQRVPLVLVQHE